MKTALLLRTLLLVMPALACSRPEANGLFCSDGNSCPPGLRCYPTSAHENRCFDRPLFPTCSGAALCEDFEGAMLGGWFLINHNDSTLMLDGTRVHTGEQSLHTSVLPHDPNAPPPNNISQAQLTQAVSVAPDIFMRLFINQSSIFPNFVEIAALQENLGDYRGATLWLNTGKLEVDAPYPVPDAATPANLLRVGDRILPTDKWICLEWQVHVGQAGFLRAWIDDELQPELEIQADTSLVAPASGEGSVVVAGLGFFSDEADFKSYDVWFDDITVSPERIYCQPRQ